MGCGTTCTNNLYPSPVVDGLKRVLSGVPWLLLSATTCVGGVSAVATQARTSRPPRCAMHDVDTSSLRDRSDREMTSPVFLKEGHAQTLNQQTVPTDCRPARLIGHGRLESLRFRH